MDYNKLDPLGVKLSKNIDQRIKDFWFKYYSRTREHDLDATIDTYDDRTYNGVLNRAQGYLGEYMQSLIEWFKEVDEPAEPKNITMDW